VSAARPAARASWGIVAATGLLSCATTSASGLRREPESAEVREQLQQIQTIGWQQFSDDAERSALAGDFTRSEQYFTAALQRGGPPEVILPKLLRVCVSAHRYRAAIEYARPYLLTHEGAWALRFLVATIHVGLSEPMTASRHLELVVQHNPRHAEAEFLLASLYRDDLRDLGRADEHFRRYLALEPEGEHAGQARQALLTRVDEAAAREREREPTDVAPTGAGPTVVRVETDSGAAGAGAGILDAGARDSDGGRRR
jgi:hypothetical protein